jgi:hypothetical protein
MTNLITKLFINLHNYIPLTGDAEFDEKVQYLNFSGSYSGVVSFDDSGIALKKLIEHTYISGVDRLEGINVDNGIITGIFYDSSNKFKFRIKDGYIQYHSINRGLKDGIPLATSYSEILNFAKVGSGTVKRTNKDAGGYPIVDKTGKTKYCTPNKTFACGKRCIAVGKECKNPLNQEQKQLQQEVIEKADTSKTKKEKGVPTATEKKAEDIVTTSLIDKPKRGRKASEKNTGTDETTKSKDDDTKENLQAKFYAIKQRMTQSVKAGNEVKDEDI